MRSQEKFERSLPSLRAGGKTMRTNCAIIGALLAVEVEEGRMTQAEADEVYEIAIKNLLSLEE